MPSHRSLSLMADSNIVYDNRAQCSPAPSVVLAAEASDKTLRRPGKMPYQSVFRPDLFKGQTIIVTGGGSGIGRCTAHELSALGANVAILGRTLEKLIGGAP